MQGRRLAAVFTRAPQDFSSRPSDRGRQPLLLWPLPLHVPMSLFVYVVLHPPLDATLHSISPLRQPSTVVAILVHRTPRPSEHLRTTLAPFVVLPPLVEHEERVRTRREPPDKHKRRSARRRLTSAWTSTYSDARGFDSFERFARPFACAAAVVTVSSRSVHTAAQPCAHSKTR